MIERLQNSGIAVLNPEPPDTDVTIIVVGIPRSGTSMVGAILHHSGVFLGDKADGAVFEDIGLAEAIETGDGDASRRIIGGYDACHRRWAFKRPMAYAHLDPSLQMFRRPRVIATFRDPVAIAKRNEVSLGVEFVEFLDDAVRKCAALVSFIRTARAPTLLLSYEKAIANPEGTVSAVADFCGLCLSPERRRHIARFVSNGPEEYLLASQTVLNRKETA